MSNHMHILLKEKKLGDIAESKAIGDSKRNASKHHKKTVRWTVFLILNNLIFAQNS